MFKRIALGMMLVGLMASLPSTGLAANVEELERRLDLVTEELQKLKNESTVAAPDYSSDFGLGPAASKVYKLSKGLSIGGYGEAKYTSYVDDEGSKADTADMTRFILYTGYKFTDSILLNTEIEFEHAKTSDGADGEVAVEFAALDFLLDEKINLRAGLVLVPMGITNEQHEPTLFHGNDRPLVERQVIPATWREMGLGAFGKISEGLDYKLFLVNGLDAESFGAKGIRDGRQNGSKTRADDWAVVARLDYEPVLGVNLGAGTYLGNSGQGRLYSGKEADVFTQIYEAHGQFKKNGLELKALGSLVKINDTELLGGVPERISGWYTEAAYDVAPLVKRGTTQYLAPFVRVEGIDYAGSNEDVNLFVAGLSYKPIPNVVIKADYRNFDNRKKSDPADEVNLGIGFIF